MLRVTYLLATLKFELQSPCLQNFVFLFRGSSSNGHHKIESIFVVFRKFSPFLTVSEHNSYKIN